MPQDSSHDSPSHSLDRRISNDRHIALSWRRGLTISFAIVFAVEVLIMASLMVVPIEFGTWSEAFIDATLLGLGAGALAWVFVVRPLGTEIAQERQVIADTQARLRSELERREEDARIQRALEWAADEEGVLDVVVSAADSVLPRHAVQLRMADSSRAHLRRVDGELGADEAGCHVASPHECIAVQQGYMLQFASSDALDACPKLREARGEASCSAVCTPVTVLGESVGVLHALGPDQSLVDSVDTARLQTIGASAGNRLSLLRALADSQIQASVDYLTGLLNRRSLRAEANAVIEDGRPYAVMMLDLDHFKRLNDSHGHDTGDRALRLFSDAFAVSAGDDSLAGRWGGEEFVAVLPGGDVSTAVAAAEEVRSNLANTLRTGMVPAFTVSIGVADSTQAPTFDDTLNLADEALFRAKNTGRDRVVPAHELTELDQADSQAA